MARRWDVTVTALTWCPVCSAAPGLARVDAAALLPGATHGQTHALCGAAVRLFAELPAVAVHQPYAELIARGADPGAAIRKSIELRDKHTSVRGPLVITSTLTIDGDAMRRRDIADVLGEQGRTQAIRALGVTVALVNLIDSRWPEAGDEERAFHPTAGKRCWVLGRQLARLKPEKVRNMPGIFKVPASLVALER